MVSGQGRARFCHGSATKPTYVGQTATFDASNVGASLRTALKRILVFFPYGTLIVAALLATVRVTVRDTFQVAAFVYYSSPPVVIAALMVVSGVILYRRRRRRVAALVGAVAIGLLAVWVHDSFRFSTVAARAASHRAVVWNVMSGRLGWGGVYQKLGEFDADVIVLVEAWQDADVRKAMLEQSLPGYHVIDDEAGLLVLSRTPLRLVESGSIARGGHFLMGTIALDDTSLTVIGVDIESDPRRFRKEPLEGLAELVSTISDRAVLVAGDFNTPTDSVYFARLRSMMRNGFEAAGWGYGPTWPSCAPVLQLDQIWVNSRVELRGCAAAWTIRSDHRPVTVEFGVPTATDD